MIKYEDQCCGCAVPAYPCLGSECPRKNVLVKYCDICDKETDELYSIDWIDYCSECYDKLLYDEE